MVSAKRCICSGPSAPRTRIGLAAGYLAHDPDRDTSAAKQLVTA
jgi:hypothetical protein